MDYGALINLLRAKKEITPLEKGILDTWNELQKRPFDMHSSQMQIVLNKCSHPDLKVKVDALPSTVTKPQTEITAADNQYVLQCQLAFLVEKELEELCNGK